MKFECVQNSGDRRRRCRQPVLNTIHFEVSRFEFYLFCLLKNHSHAEDWIQWALARVCVSVNSVLLSVYGARARAHDRITLLFHVRCVNKPLTHFSWTTVSSSIHLGLRRIRVCVRPLQWNEWESISERSVCAQDRQSDWMPEWARGATKMPKNGGDWSVSVLGLFGHLAQNQTIPASQHRSNAT